MSIDARLQRLEKALGVPPEHDPTAPCPDCAQPRNRVHVTRLVVPPDAEPYELPLLRPVPGDDCPTCMPTRTLVRVRFVVVEPQPDAPR